MSDPKISVVMPVYNAERYLVPAVNSILAQSFVDFELIAVDDGSTDRSSHILADFAGNDARVRILRQQNGGVTNALNAGLAAARGSYIARMDADDIAWPERFERQVAALDAQHDLVALGTCFRLIDPEGRILRNFMVPMSHDEIDTRLVRDQTLAICHPSAILRATALDHIGGYDVTYNSAQDIDLFLRLGEVGRLGNLPETLLDYRQHFKSMGYAKRHGQLCNAWNAGRAAARRRGLAFEQPMPKDAEVEQKPAHIWCKWGWWALSAGHVKTARHYALKACLAAPFSKASWHLALMALRGY